MGLGVAEADGAGADDDGGAAASGAEQAVSARAARRAVTVSGRAVFVKITLLVGRAPRIRPGTVRSDGVLPQRASLAGSAGVSPTLVTAPVSGEGIIVPRGVGQLIVGRALFGQADRLGHGEIIRAGVA